MGGGGGGGGREGTPYALALAQATLGFHTCVRKGLWRGALVAFRKDDVGLVAENAETGCGAGGLALAHGAGDEEWRALVVALAAVGWKTAVAFGRGGRRIARGSCMDVAVRMGDFELVARLGIKLAGLLPSRLAIRIPFCEPVKTRLLAVSTTGDA